MPSDFVFKPIRELAELVKNRSVSPVELAEAFLGRLESLGPELNAVVTVTRARGMEQARAAEREIASGNYRGPLHGIPFGAKDLLATSGGIPTTWGAEPFRRRTFDHDATVVLKLEEAGAVLLAKLAMVELAGGMGYDHPDASLTGPGINPWDRTKWTGGSSSGSGSAVAAGLVPFAIGSETWGSILSPAGNCGLAGLRPTYGRVSRYGAMALCWTLDKLGPLCLTADDCGLVLDAIAGHDPNDPSSTTREFAYDAGSPAGGRLKLALFRGTYDEFEDDMKSNFEAALDELRGVADIEELELPDYPYEAITRTILDAEVSAAFDDFMASGKTHQLRAPGDRYGAMAGTAVLAKDYLRAIRLRGSVGEEIDKLMAGFDAVVAPGRPGVAQAVDRKFAGIEEKAPDYMGAIGNGMGLPAAIVPTGFSASGLPTSIQFMGRAYDENEVLRPARIYQSLTDWHRQHPAGLES